MQVTVIAMRRGAFHLTTSSAAVAAALMMSPPPAWGQAASSTTATAASPVAAAQPAPDAAPSTDQNGLADIVVTAERQASSAQKVPAAVTVQSGSDLLSRGKFALTDILEVVPGVSGGESQGLGGVATGSDNAAAGITIRGISSNGAISGQTISGVSAIALYVDDITSGLGGSYDIDRVEVLRGPQGTLYGRSATGGVVAIHTRDPSLGKSSADVSVEAGSFDLLHATLAANVPIVSDKVALRVALNHYERDGIDAETGNGRSNVTEGRAKLLLQPTDNFSLLIGGAFQDRTLYNGGSVGNFTNPTDIVFTPYLAGAGSLKSRQVWAEANLDVGGVRLTYLPSYRTFEQDTNVFLVGPGGNTIRQVVRTPHDPFMTHELRIQSQPEATIKWQTGLFYYYNDVKSSNSNVWNASNALLFSADVRRKTKNIGVFAEATVPVTDQLKLTGGLRYDETTVATSEFYQSNVNVFCNTPLGSVTGCAVGTVDLPQAGLPENIASISVSEQDGRRTFKNVTYKARAEYEMAANKLLYASISTGFIPGDVQVGTGAGNLPQVFAYGSEKLTAYEIGTKNRFLGQKLQINANLFHYDYGGYQAAIQLDLRNPASAVVFNVPLRMTGVELEALYQITPADRIGLNLGYTASKFHDLPPQFAEAVSQRKLWGFSPATATAFYDRRFELSSGSAISFHGEAIWRAGYDVLYTSPAQAAEGGNAYQHQRSFVLGNASLTWNSPDERFSLTAYVRNIGDIRYKTYVNLQSLAPLQATGLLSDPRTAGVVLTAKF